MSRRTQLVLAVWVAMCLTLFVVMLRMPVPGRVPGTWRECPSLLTITQLGTNPSAEEKGQLGIRGGGEYYQCRTIDRLERWGPAVLFGPAVLCAAGVGVLALNRRRLAER